MYREVSLILAGIGGYGHFYLRHLLEDAEQAGIRFLAAADPRPAGSPFLDQLQDRGVEIFPDLASCLAVHRADLVVIAAPIHFHAELTALSLAHGAHVLCEKPLCATVAEATAMAQAEAQAGRFVAVGYQWSFSEAIQALKRDIQAGVLGQPRRFKTCVLWPRGAAYYARNNWAGRIRSQDGRWVLDSPASNAQHVLRLG
jgi:predicted dehydrogenase